MTLGRIKLLALRQLDEDPQDISEYDGVFTMYANMGYAIAVREYLRPRAMRLITTDENGCAEAEGVVRVIELRDEAGNPVSFMPTADGKGICTASRKVSLTAICEINYPDLEKETDEPKLPENVHSALADYICYRHLSTGSLTKQNRAQFFLASFLQQMRTIRPAWRGSTSRYKNLFEVTACRKR